MCAAHIKVLAQKVHSVSNTLVEQQLQLCWCICV